MRDNRFSNGTNPPIGSPRLATTATAAKPEDDDARLFVLEGQLNYLVNELIAAQKAGEESSIHPDPQSLVKNSISADAESNNEATTKQIEAILARLYPIEQAIMQTPARTIAGLGVKARHAIYVMSQYWEEPIDRIDWEARVMRSLVEAVCRLANAPLPIVKAVADGQP